MWRGLPFEVPPEGTEFSDANYAVVGKALSYVVEFEECCRALNMLMHVMTQQIIHRVNFEDNASIQRLVEDISRLRLKRHMDQIQGSLKVASEALGLSDDRLAGVLEAARIGRNVVVHEICVGIHDDIETDGARERLMTQVSEAIRAVAEGVRAVELITCGATREPTPTGDYLRVYPDKVVEWVCSTDDA